MILHHLLAITIAVVIDLFIGDPPDWPHPVKAMGSLIAKLEKHWNRGQGKQAKGIGMLISVMFAAGGTALLVTLICYQIHPVAGILTESLLISTAIAQRSLKEAALTVYEPLNLGNMAGAREKLSYIVGRDTDKLEEPDIVRGTIETVAENTSDGITAPLFWALIGGAPAAIMYRAINTCDSMVGYKNEKYLEFGWASARMDDLVNYIPSRLTSFAMLLSSRPEHMTVRQAWRTVFRDAKKHPSPNSGWGEAAVAALLGIQLGGVNYYNGVISNRATMGDPVVTMGKAHILKANRIVSRTVPTFMIFLWLGGMLFEMAATWF
ncbi:adenosylcobinamide-phosphate synthase CbiB [Mesobacillus zeae]|uniref:Cobalamin biosynthesis protein CobD n=1 Tax=Mesobacillus zeae TaxID=1917180 RepID=A0A398B710_9BACI|nr:adenosylcobinamide-phosphate synthase CbiB [Mesobacillus zeae]RID85735.1 cobalamin biosynthesis protein CobD [Mesobacillus zeae]